MYEREEQATQEKEAPPCGRALSGHASSDVYPAGRGQSGETGGTRRACPCLSRALPGVRHAILYHRATQQTACPALSDAPLRTLASGCHHASGGHCPVVALQSDHCLSAVPGRSLALPEATSAWAAFGTRQRATVARMERAHPARTLSSGQCQCGETGGVPRFDL